MCEEEEDYMRYVCVAWEGGKKCGKKQREDDS